MQLVSGHGGRLLQLLVDQHLASSRDSSIRTAMLQLMQQLLVPKTLQQLLASGTSPAERHTAAVKASAAETGHEGGAKHVEEQPTVADAGSAGDSTARSLLEQLLSQLLEGGGAGVVEAGFCDSAAGGDAAAADQLEWL